MIILKILFLILTIGASSAIGILLSQKYACREKEIKEMKTALNMFATKIKFTYEPIPSLFQEIDEKIGGNIGNIFKKASIKMLEKTAGEAWEETLKEEVHNLNKEDITVLKNLSKMLGQTDLEGQLSEIEVVNEFLNAQLENAIEERKKNERMYRTLGLVCGLTIAIILI